MQGSIRLVNKTAPASLIGNPQIFLNNEWSSVCSNTVTIKDMQVMCRQLGYTFASSMSDDGSLNGLPIYELKCSGDEQSITECPYQRIQNPGSCTDNSLKITCTGNILFCLYT